MTINENSENTGGSPIQYTTAISKGAAMIDEMKRLLVHWNPSESVHDFAERIHDEGILGGATAYRTRDIVKRVFAQRLLKPDDRPAKTLKRVLENRLPPRTFTDMLFLYSCRADPLIYDFTIKEYWPSLRRGKITLTTQDGVDFLTEARMDGRLDNEWSDNTMKRISRCLLGMLRDVGFLKGTKGKKEIAHYTVSDEAVALMAVDLHERGITDAALSVHSDWTLFGLQGDRPLEILERLGESVGLTVQRAGAVVRMTWTIHSTEELIDVLSRRNF